MTLARKTVLGDIVSSTAAQLLPPFAKGGMGGFLPGNDAMRPYNHSLKRHARHLRTHMTDSERRLWSRLRGKQLWGVQVYRQKPLGPYIVDFYAPQVGMVIEIDGAQHLEEAHVTRDTQRDAYLQRQGLRVLRFHNIDVLQRLDEVVAVIFREMGGRLVGGDLSGNPP